MWGGSFFHSSLVIIRCFHQTLEQSENLRAVVLCFAVGAAKSRATAGGKPTGRWTITITRRRRRSQCILQYAAYARVRRLPLKWLLCWSNPVYCRCSFARLLYSFCLPQTSSACSVLSVLSLRFIPSSLRNSALIMRVSGIFAREKISHLTTFSYFTLHYITQLFSHFSRL